MVDFNHKIRILFFILSTILSVHTLKISILKVLTDFQCKTYVTINKTADGKKINTYLQPIHHVALDLDYTVIIFVVPEKRYEEIAHFNAAIRRSEIAEGLKKSKYELIVLGTDCSRNENKLLRDFIKDFMTNHRFRLFPFQAKWLDLSHFGGIDATAFKLPDGTLDKYLTQHFPEMEYKSKRPDPCNIKHVKFYDLQKSVNEMLPGETICPISVQNGEYDPTAGSKSKRVEYIFTKKYPSHSCFHIVVVDGMDYDRLMRISGLENFFQRLVYEMSATNEILLIMGCFNFDWSDIGVVHKIILAHSEQYQNSIPCQVSTIGVGMFGTLFENPNLLDPRRLARTLNEQAKELALKCNHNNGKLRDLGSFEVWDLNAKSCTYEHTISQKNGQYYTPKNFHKYRFSTNYHQNWKFAFFVMDVTEMNDKDAQMKVLLESSEKKEAQWLKENFIAAFVIKTVDFQLYDLHIIPEWVEYHRGDVNPNQITILGGGKFDTIYQYLSPLYQVLYTPFNVQTELKEFRQLFVNTTENKVVSVLNIYSLNLEPQIYRMHTINGFYDPVYLQKNEMLETDNVKNILFLIMDGEKFKAMGTPPRSDLIKNLTQDIVDFYPSVKWTVFLVGLHNFRESDAHLFAEFVKIHTNDKREFHEFVHTYRDTPIQTIYGYKDTKPFTIINERLKVEKFKKFFRNVLI